MSAKPTILLVKESRSGEQRVALIPADVYKLIQNDYIVFVEDQAGVGAGYDNTIYESVGAKICKIQNYSLDAYHSIFKNIDMIVRVKRPHRAREILENLTIRPHTKMIGSLELLEKNSTHVKEYRAAGIDYYSFDQFYFPPNTPMDALKKMSAFAGVLSIEDAIKKCSRLVKKAVVIGFGEAGKAAYEECLRRSLLCTVVTSQKHQSECIKSQRGMIVYLSRKRPLHIRQEKIKNIIKDADIIISTASSNGVIAPILIPRKTLLTLPPNTVIVDLAVTEGGNVEGSQRDATLYLGNGVLVTNVSGYPKKIPLAASVEWSTASYYFINRLVNKPESLKRR